QLFRIEQGEADQLVLGQYVILDQLGEGGMGVVYRAFHRRMQREVAIKIVAPSVLHRPVAIERFYREVRAAAKLLHPNIVTAFDADDCNGQHYLVMEYVQGRDLARRLNDAGPLPVSQVIDYIAQAARGLAYAHERNIVHRDIKPANLLLDDNGVVKVLDMGLARIRQHEAATPAPASELTVSGQIMGTLEYMAPEQAEDVTKADHRADIYSLGCTMHRLLTGATLYGGNTVTAQMIAHREQPIPSLALQCEGVPDELDALFQRMVAKRPEDRPASMAEVIESLEKCQAAASAIQQQELSTPPSALAKAARPNRSRSLLWARIALALLFFAVFATVFIVRLPNGATLRVEIDDPQLEVAVKGSDVVLRKGANETRIRAGKQTLLVSRGDDFTFEVDKLVLKDGDKTTLAVTIVDDGVELLRNGELIHREPVAKPEHVPAPPAPPTPPAGTADTGRAPRAKQPVGSSPTPKTTGDDLGAAKWLLSVGGIIHMSPDEDLLNDYYWFDNVDKLPKDPATAQLIGVVVNSQGDGADITDADFARLAGLRHLQMIHLGNPENQRVEGTGARHLADSPLISFGLFNSHVGITEEGAREIAELKSLRVLRFDYNPGINPRTLKILCTLPQLHTLNIYGYRGAEPLLPTVAACKQLRVLNVGASGITDAAAPDLAQLTHLEELMLETNHFSDAVMPALSKLTNLRRMTLSVGAITPAKILQLSKTLPKCELRVHFGLDIVIVMNGEFQDRTAAQWALSQGASIRVDNETERRTELPDGVFRLRGVYADADQTINLRKITSLNGLSGLEELEINRGMDDVAVEALRDLPNLRSLSLSHAEGKGATDMSIPHLTRFPKLRSLDLVQSGFNREAIRRLATMPEFRELTELRLSHIDDDDTLRALTRLGKLQRLSLRLSQVSPATAQTLSALPLRSLMLDDSHVNDECVGAFARLEGLQELSLQRTQVTLAGLKALAGLKSLKQLDIRGVRLSDEELRELRALLPSCRILANK
ncbi:MAG: protein kinase, partial [Planctomycetales bacterium]|nr:protein kinase [Planctomycetales bacterium]